MAPIFVNARAVSFNPELSVEVSLLEHHSNLCMRFFAEICAADSCGPQKKCRLSADMQSKECVCAVAELTAGLINQPLCTTRRQYFDSLTEMIIDGCSRNITHNVDYYGSCRGNCLDHWPRTTNIYAILLATCESHDGKVICEPGLRCLLNPVTELPTCAP